jgi:hypothetical protein
MISRRVALKLGASFALLGESATLAAPTMSTRTIAATSNPRHAADNVKAGSGRLPDAAWLEG